MDLTSQYATLRIKNPVVLSSAGVTATVDRMKRAEDAGAAAVVMKSLFENPVPRSGDPSPHMLVLHGRIGQLHSDSFYSYEQASRFDEHRYAEEVYLAKKSLEIPVVANLDCRSTEAWTKYAKLVEQAGADAVEVKMCPHGEFHGMPLPDVIRLVRKTVKIPVVGKLLPQLDNPVSAYLDASATGADGIVMFNRMSGLDIDVETMAPVMHGGIAGYGGAWYKHFCLRWIAECQGRADLPITGSGGVGSGEDVVKYILAGARSVEIATLVIFEGYGAIARVLDETAEWMERKQVACLAGVTGLAARALKHLEQIDRSTLHRAVIDPGKCIGCGRCSACCFREACSQAGGVAEIDQRCEGCGLCLSVCPSGAISLAVRQI